VSFHLAVCLSVCQKPLPKRAVQIVRSRASSFRCEYPLLFLRSSSSILCLLPRLPVTSIPPFIIPPITCRRRQFLRKMWPIQLAFRLLISCRIFLARTGIILTLLLYFTHRGFTFAALTVKWSFACLITRVQIHSTDAMLLKWCRWLLLFVGKQKAPFIANSFPKIIFAYKK
jgi:hypothetical protein